MIKFWKTKNDRSMSAEPGTGNQQQSAVTEELMRYLSDMADLTVLNQGFDIEKALEDFEDDYKLFRAIQLGHKPENPEEERARYLASRIEDFKRDMREKSAVYGTPDTVLGDNDIYLGELIAGYKYCSPLYISAKDVHYKAESREVRYRSILPGGPQGYCTVRVPEELHTVADLLNYLKCTHGFVLK